MNKREIVGLKEASLSEIIQSEAFSTDVLLNEVERRIKAFKKEITKINEKGELVVIKFCDSLTAEELENLLNDFRKEGCILRAIDFSQCRALFERID